MILLAAFVIAAFQGQWVIAVLLMLHWILRG